MERFLAAKMGTLEQEPLYEQGTDSREGSHAASAAA
jgi:hypothetical protein